MSPPPMHQRAPGAEAKRLSSLLALMPPERMRLIGADREVDHASQDSREVGPGGLFCASRGSSWDGHAFIAAAIGAGCSAIIAEREPESGDGFDPASASWVVVDDALYALACVSAAWYGHPGRDVKVLATTGTNGKTTTTFLLRQIAERLGLKTGLVSTVEILIHRDKQPTIFTTPPSPTFQHLLATMRERGCSHALVEASSHGLHQHRIAAFEVAVGGFTNLSRDHLDYHGSMEDYEEVKSRLFTELAASACINIDAEVGQRMAARFAARHPHRLVTVSPHGRPATLSAIRLSSGLSGLSATIAIEAGPSGLATPRTVELSSPLIGRHNLENLLVALGMALLAGFPLEETVRALATAPGAPGRMEPVRLERPPAPLPAVFVDYAHTPDALDNALAALRPLTPGRLLCVFGAGGDRDRGKRPEMAHAAARHADLLVVTSDNPRTEDPERILDDIVAGLSDGPIVPRGPLERSVQRITDRAAAIRFAVTTAAPEDAILIAGKGHEDYQIVGATRHPFDDRVVAHEALLTRATAPATRAQAVTP